jgi:hypothetical protein
MRWEGLVVLCCTSETLLRKDPMRAEPGVLLGSGLVGARFSSSASRHTKRFCKELIKKIL